MNSRLKYLRTLRGITQRQLGEAVGFSKRSADIRISQYESGDRSPKAQLKASIAKALNVSPYALFVPNIADANSLMHLLFVLEDTYGLSIAKDNDTVCLRLRDRNGRIYQMLLDWYEQAALLSCGKIDRMAYDEWRYSYEAYQGAFKSQAMEGPAICQEIISEELS